MVSNSVMRCSLHTLLLLSLSSTTLAATNLFSRKPPARLLAQLSLSSHFQDASAVVIAAQCRPGEIACNDGCMPSMGVCCTDGGGGFCKQGFSCVTDGCCPIGHVCSDEITCDLGEVPCGEKKCMPKNGVCCPNGAYCQAGEECSQNGFDHFCQRVGGSGDPSNGDGSKTTGGTIGIAQTSSSRSQSTSLSTTTQGEAPASTSTSAETQTEIQTEESTTQTQAEDSTSTPISSQKSSSIPFNQPVVTPFLPNPSTTSTTTTEVASSSTTAAAPATTTNGGTPAAVKMSGVTLALVFVSTIMMVL
ncbi:hypothetical protein THARTR1_07532 [Trichoderma harzianum]|uniref:Uncharacterized protein n=1 Tax=Trichoderma harzianum TaxID=5544 RepID=A0A2K0U1V9_TRIHA|nr:hypothetical protein THARTR1_07532 [Trichoderma harzianum]